MGIRSKLVVGLLLANGLLAGLMFWLTSQSFEKGFLDYINQVEIQKLQPLLDELVEYHNHYDGWNWINQEQRRLWHDLIEKHVTGRDSMPRPGMRRPPPHEGGGKPRSRPSWREHDRPPPPPRFRPGGPDQEGMVFDPRLLLKNAQGELVIGPQQQAGQSIWLPIADGELTLGQLGVTPRTRLSTQLDLLFAYQQKRNFANIIVAVVIIALSLALMMAMFFLKPIHGLNKGVRQLAEGDFDTIVPVGSSDELGRLAKNVNRLAKILRQNQHARRQWIADISHELRTPVTILQGELEALIEGVRELEPSNLISLQQEVRRLGQLIADLYELSMSDLGAISYQFTVCDLNELVKDFVDQYQQKLDKSGLLINSTLAEKPLKVLADEDRFMQSLSNLLQNSLRYTDAPGDIKIDLSHHHDSAMLTWEDSSPGVGEKDLGRLFERLYRVDRSRNRNHGGAGLGLSICKNIVQAHEGNIEAFHSDMGGLGIRIHLPITSRMDRV